MTSSSPLRSTLRALRTDRGLSQAELASRVGLSRQALLAIEAGRSIPGTDVALRLAAALSVRVDELFRLDEPPAELRATRAAGSAPASGEVERVTLAEIDGRWIAHPIRPTGRDALSRAADGLARRGRGLVRVAPLGALEVARARLVVMGCAPALGLLAARLSARRPSVELTWLQGGSTAAIEALGRGEIHVAGLHLLDEPSGRYNEPVLRRRLPGSDLLLVNLASWEEGILVAKDNPLRIRGAADLLRPKVRFVAREPGAGAHGLLARALRAAGLKDGRLGKQCRIATGHFEVAEAISLGAADAGIAIRSAAQAYDLGFLPLAQERFDLAIPRALAADPRIERLVDTLGSHAFRRELDAAGGYLTQETGQQVGATKGR